MTGLIVLGVALAASVALGVWYQRSNGRFRNLETADAAMQDSERLSVQQIGAQQIGAQQIGASLGERATLVQFSSAFCAPCRATRALLTDVASGLEGVEAVEIDAESHLDLVRELDVMRTPTTFVLDARGMIVTRAAGLPKRDQVLRVLAAIPGIERPES